MQPPKRDMARANGEWAVVTGASSGIGRAFALELVRQGHPVLLVARRRDRLEEVARDIVAGGGRAEVLDADLGSAAGVDAVVDRAIALGGAGVLINDAGFGRSGSFAEIPLAEALAEISVNVTALVALTRRLLPLMLARGRGRIINLASIVSFMPTPYFAVYGATKAFVLHFTEALAYELRGTGVRVLAACPGVVKSEFAAVASAEQLERRLPVLSPETVARTSLRAVDSRRVVRVIGVVTKILAFLPRISPRALVRFVNGWLFGEAARQGALRRGGPPMRVLPGSRT
jgi:uncharacterized protein